MNIADLFIRILANDLDFKADVVKKAQDAGDAAGMSLGERMGSAVKRNGAKLIGAVGALVGGIALRGLQELQGIEADFRVETGATADEAKRAGKAINDMSGRNIQPMREIGDTLIKIHTDLGLTGTAAESLTERFLRFARVTKRNAAEEVKSFDDILDSWNLTADKSGGIMDALVVSHQRYGGVIAQDEAALAALAPALIATNQTWEDGLALINLFKASGVDVEVAIGGITKALTKIKSPEQLRALINDIIATEDPLARAAKASDLFGAKAGPKLANVLRPGIGALEDYKITADEAAGATETAATVLDNEWGARFQLLLKQAGAAIIGFGNDWGGLATVIATTLTVAGGLGGGKLLTLLSGGLSATWRKAAGSAPVSKAIAFASDKAATLYLRALLAGDVVGGALTKAWAATGGRILTAAGVSGAAAGRAFAFAASAAIVAAPVATIIVALKIADDVRQAKAGLAGQIDKVIQEGTLEGLQHAKDVLQAQIGSEKILGIIPFQFAGEVDAMNAEIARIDAAIAALPPTLNTTTSAATALGVKGGDALLSLSAKAAILRANVASQTGAIATLLHGLTQKLLGEATALINGYYDPIIAQDDLRVQKDTVNAAIIARNATTAGSAERHQANLTLDNARKALDETRANLLASGQLTKADQKAWLSELETRYKTATGSAKTYIGQLITKLHELQHQPTTVVQIIAKLGFQNIGNIGTSGARARGGPVVAGRPYLVNEETPNSEIWVPDVSGRVLSGAQAASIVPSRQEATSPSLPPITIYNPEPRAAEDDISKTMRRLAALGM